MDLYQQHQEQQQIAPSTYTSTTQNVYAQYGTNPDGYIQYPTNHLYQQQTALVYFNFWMKFRSVSSDQNQEFDWA